MLARAEGLHRELFRPIGPSAVPAWEPPVDVLETDHEVLVLVALPGVDPDRVEAAIDGNDLVFAGTRIYPSELRTAIIHRLELPQGRAHIGDYRAAVADEIADDLSFFRTHGERQRKEQNAIACRLEPPRRSMRSVT